MFVRSLPMSTASREALFTSALHVSHSPRLKRITCSSTHRTWSTNENFLLLFVLEIAEMFSSVRVLRAVTTAITSTHTMQNSIYGSRVYHLPSSCHPMSSENSRSEGEGRTIYTNKHNEEVLSRSPWSLPRLSPVPHISVYRFYSVANGHHQDMYTFPLAMYSSPDIAALLQERRIRKSMPDT